MNVRATGEADYCQRVIELLQQLKSESAKYPVERNWRWTEPGYKQLYDHFGEPDYSYSLPEHFDIQKLRPLADWCIANGEYDLQLLGFSYYVRHGNAQESLPAARQMVKLEFNDAPEAQVVWQYGSHIVQDDRYYSLDREDLGKAILALQSAGELDDWYDGLLKRVETTGKPFSLFRQPEYTCWIAELLDGEESYEWTLRALRPLNSAYPSLTVDEQGECYPAMRMLRDRIEKVAETRGVKPPDDIYPGLIAVRAYISGNPQPTNDDEAWVLTRIRAVEQTGDVSDLLANTQELLNRLDAVGKTNEFHAAALIVYTCRTIGFRRVPPAFKQNLEYLKSHLREMLAKYGDKADGAWFALNDPDPWANVRIEPVKFEGLTSDMKCPVLYDLTPRSGLSTTPPQLFIAWINSPDYRHSLLAQYVFTKSSPFGGPLQIIGRSPPPPSFICSMRAFKNGVIVANYQGLLIVQDGRSSHYESPPVLPTGNPDKDVEIVGDRIFVMEDHRLFEFDLKNGQFVLIAGTHSLAPRNPLDGISLTFLDIEPLESQNKLIISVGSSLDNVKGIWEWSLNSNTFNRVYEGYVRALRWIDGNLLYWANGKKYNSYGTFLYHDPQSTSSDSPAGTYHSVKWPTDFKLSETDDPIYWIGGYFIKTGPKIGDPAYLLGPYSYYDPNPLLEGPLRYGFEMSDGGAWVACSHRMLPDGSGPPIYRVYGPSAGK